MITPLNRFNWIAGVYDSLTRLVFGRSFYKAQCFFLEDLKFRRKVLIIGGGTGWILRELLIVNAGCEVDYIEASSRMLAIARAEISDQDKHRVKFTLGTEKDIDAWPKYDAVITNFFLDLFDDSLDHVIQKIRASLSKHSLWIVTDFIDQRRWWHRLMLRVMYIFFNLTTGIEARRLPDYERRLANAGIKKSKEEVFFGSFIKTAIYTINE
jgi:tRNA (cmo5U34)-methyltransferase